MIRLLLILSLITLISFKSNAADDAAGSTLRESDLRQLLKAQGLDIHTQDQIISSLKSNPEAVDENSELALGGVLTTNGGNMAFFVDNDNWHLDGILKVNGQLAKVPQLFDMYYYNGGLKINIEYRWTWVFLPKGVNLNRLDGASFGGLVFGRGLAVATNFLTGLPVSVEAGWVNSDDVILDNAFILSITAGVGSDKGSKYISAKTTSGSQVSTKKAAVSISFPKIVLSQKRLLPQ